MILLHNKKGGISGQVLKDLLRDDVSLIGNNLNQTAGSQWQTIIKFRDTRQSFPAVFGYALCLHSANEKEPFIISLSEAETRAKLKSWGRTANEIENLLKITPEGK